MVEEYRQKSVKVQAIQFTFNNVEEVKDFVDSYYWLGLNNSKGTLMLNTHYYGMVQVEEGDWVVKGVNGDFYPCKIDRFGMLYQKVTN